MNSTTEPAEAFRSLVRSISLKLDLDLPTSEKFTPGKTPPTPSNKCLGALRFLFFQGRERIDNAVDCVLNGTDRSLEAFQNCLAYEIEQVRSEKRHRPFRDKVLKPDAGQAPVESATTSANTSFTSIFSTNIPLSGNNSFVTTSSQSFLNTSSQETSQSNQIDTQLDQAPVADARVESFKNDYVATDKPQKPKPTETLQDYRLRKFPTQGLLTRELPHWLDDCPWFVRYEVERLKLIHGLNLESVSETDFSELKVHPQSWVEHNDLLGDLSKLFPQFQGVAQDVPSANVWHKARKNDADVFMKATLNFEEKKAETLFRMDLSPLQTESTVGRFALHFGSNRFLDLQMPSSRALPSYLNGQEDFLVPSVLHWLNKPDKLFMGCKWTAVHLKVQKGKKWRSKGVATTSDQGFLIKLFATSGPGLVETSLWELLNWFLPVPMNMDMPAAKAYSRLQLGFSKIVPTVDFLPRQIIEAPDIYANGEASDASLRDPNYYWSDYTETSTSTVMNDGCACISRSAAEQVWRKYCRHEHGPIRRNCFLPTAFQGRLGPYKGMWMVVDDERYPHVAQWIEVTPSMRKFKPHTQDLSESSCDSARLNLGVNRVSRTPEHSTHYLDFLPILHDRGVSLESIQDNLRSLLDEAYEELETALQGSMNLVEWLGNKKTEIGNDSKLSQRPITQIIKALAEAGFDPSISRSLANYTREFAKGYFNRLTSTLNVPIQRSCALLGVADPYGCLKPDEIYIASSRGFCSVNEDSSLVKNLDGFDAVVARHPALRVSDMQRVHCVYKAELQAFEDVIVFSTRGQVPLASKLQGGDYDGDTFWIYWEPCLVKDFCNAPAPEAPPKPEDLGIKVDTKLLSDIFVPSIEPLAQDCQKTRVTRSTAKEVKSLMQRAKDLKNDKASREFLAHGFELSMSSQFLGTVTVYLEKLRYTRKPFQDPELEKLIDLHDLLVDSEKNGYCFDSEQWKNFKRQISSSVGKVDIAYKSALDHDLDDYVTKSIPFNNENMIDNLVFDFAKRYAFDLMQKFSLEVAKGQNKMFADDDITAYRKYLCSAGGIEVEKEITRMKESFRAWQSELWPRAHVLVGQRSEHKDKKYGRAKAIGYERFRALNPSEEFLNRCNLAASWQVKSLRAILSPWEMLKTAVWFEEFSGTPWWCFGVAWSEICQVKALNGEHLRLFGGDSAEHARVKRRRHAAPKAQTSSEFVMEEKLVIETNVRDEVLSHLVSVEEIALAPDIAYSDLADFDDLPVDNMSANNTRANIDLVPSDYGSEIASFDEAELCLDIFPVTLAHETGLLRMSDDGILDELQSSGQNTQEMLVL